MCWRLILCCKSGVISKLSVYVAVFVDYVGDVRRVDDALLSHFDTPSPPPFPLRASCFVPSLPRALHETHSSSLLASSLASSSEFGRHKIQRSSVQEEDSRSVQHHEDLRRVASRRLVQRGTAGTEAKHTAMRGVCRCGESAGADEEGPHKVGGGRLPDLPAAFAA